MEIIKVKRSDASDIRGIVHGDCYDIDVHNVNPLAPPWLRLLRITSRKVRYDVFGCSTVNRVAHDLMTNFMNSYLLFDRWKRPRWNIGVGG